MQSSKQPGLDFNLGCCGDSAFGAAAPQGELLLAALTSNTAETEKSH